MGALGQDGVEYSFLERDGQVLHDEKSVSMPDGVTKM